MTGHGFSHMPEISLHCRLSIHDASHFRHTPHIPPRPQRAPSPPVGTMTDKVWHFQHRCEAVNIFKTAIGVMTSAQYSTASPLYLFISFRYSITPLRFIYTNTRFGHSLSFSAMIFRFSITKFLVALRYILFLAIACRRRAVMLHFSRQDDKCGDD